MLFPPVVVERCDTLRLLVRRPSTQGRMGPMSVVSSLFGSCRFQGGLSYLPQLSVKPLRVAPAEPGVYLWELEVNGAGFLG